MPTKETRLSIEELKARDPHMTLEQFRSGDPDAFRELTPYLRRRAARIVGDHVVDDVVQDAYVNITSGLSKKTPDDFANSGDSIVPYAVVATRRAAINHLRNAGRKKRGSTVPHELNIERSNPHAKGPEEEAVIATSWEDIRRKVNDDDQTRVLYLRSEGFKSIEIAEMFNVDPITVGTRLHRARKRARIAVREHT